MEKEKDYIEIPVTFNQTILAGTQGKIIEFVPHFDFEIIRYRVEFYLQARELRVLPRIMRMPTKISENLLMFSEGSENFLAGDDNYKEYPIYTKGKAYDKIQLVVDNVSDVNDYDLNFDYIIRALK